MKKVFILLALAVFLVAGVYSVIYMAQMPPTYDAANTPALALAEAPADYDVSDADGVASVIVKENLDKTRAVNAVTAIVFDFRGYDTMGESFILLTAIAGSMAILRKSRKGGAENHDK